MNVGIWAEAALFPEKEYIMEIYFAVQLKNLKTIGAYTESTDFIFKTFKKSILP